MGGLGEAKYSFEILEKMDFVCNLDRRMNCCASLAGPPTVPPIFIIVKYEVSAFTGKKIKSFGQLDQFLRIFEIWVHSCCADYISENAENKLFR